MLATIQLNSTAKNLGIEAPKLIASQLDCAPANRVMRPWQRQRGWVGCTIAGANVCGQGEKLLAVARGKKLGER